MAEGPGPAGSAQGIGSPALFAPARSGLRGGAVHPPQRGGQITDEIEPEISRRFGSPVLRTLLATALGLGLLAPLSGHAGELKPVQGQSFDLGSMRGVAYYTVEPDGYRVVATFAGENVSPVRVSAILRAGQSATLSVPGGLGESGTSLRIDRAGDRVTVSPTRAPGPGH